MDKFQSLVFNQYTGLKTKFSDLNFEDCKVLRITTETVERGGYSFYNLELLTGQGVIKMESIGDSNKTLLEQYRDSLKKGILLCSRRVDVGVYIGDPIGDTITLSLKPNPAIVLVDASLSKKGEKGIVVFTSEPRMFNTLARYWTKRHLGEYATQVLGEPKMSHLEVIQTFIKKVQDYNPSGDEVKKEKELFLLALEELKNSIKGSIPGYGTLSFNVADGFSFKLSL